MDKCLFNRIAVILGLLSLIISCKDERKNKVSNIVNSQTRYDSDTICLDQVQKFDNKQIKLISACQIILNDSTSRLYNKKIGSGELSKDYNFDRATPLLYKMESDTLSVELLYLNSPLNKIVPKIVDFRNDTLFLQEEIKGKIDYSISATIHKYKYVILFKEHLKKPPIVLGISK